MPKKKGYTPTKYKEELIKLLSRELFLSTTEICQRLNIGYDTAIKYLGELQKAGEIKVKKVGKNRFWSLGDMFFTRFHKGIFLVNVLGIIYDPKKKKILIGRRKFDPYVKNLTWGFPGGRPEYGKSLEQSLVNEIKKKTGLRVKVKKIIFARSFAERGEIMLLYYWCLCEPSSGKERPGDKFVELKWIKPTEVKKYFTTSIDPFVFRFLKKLERL